MEELSKLVLICRLEGEYWVESKPLQIVQSPCRYYLSYLILCWETFRNWP